MFIIQRCRVLFLVLCISLISACVIQTKVEDVRGAQKTENELQAQQSLNEGDFQQAATLFQRLAEQPSAQQNKFRLQAAKSLLRAGEHEKAESYLNLIAAEEELTIEQQNQLQLLYAQFFLSAGNAEQAITHLQLISSAQLNIQQQRAFYEANAFAYALSGQLFASAQQRIALEPFLEGERSKENHKAILEVLGFLPVNDLESELSAQNDQGYSGWLQLAIISVQFIKGTDEMREAIEEWSSLYSQHAASDLIVSGYFEPAVIVAGNIRRVAVLLPQAGPYKNYAGAIKQGIQLAYQQLEKEALQPELRFYDTQSGDIHDIYQQAVSDGAQLVIGPLSKKHIEQLTDASRLTVPVLALNYVEGLGKENLYQFALSPIDEVQQAVKQARSEGHKNAIILAPKTADGERIMRYFQNAWEVAGGNVLVVEMFDPGANDFSFSVRQMLNVNESRNRFVAVQKTLGSIEYNARRRQDVDVIFIVATNSVARLINPYFYHNRAESVAVYGLARLYSGQPEPKQDIDLEGVGFCGIPWLFDQAYQSEPDMQLRQDARQASSAKLLSLIAFGVDAYRLIPHLNSLTSITYSGATGELLLNQDNRIERHLICAKFHKGKVQLLSTNEGVVEEKKYLFKKPIPAGGSF